MNHPSQHSLLVTASALLVLTLASPATAQEGVLFVENNRVGIGTSAPQSLLEVTSTSGTASLIVEEASEVAAARTLFSLRNNGGIRFAMQNSGSSIWQFAALANFIIDFNGNPGQEFRLEQDGDLVIGGRLSEGSSRALKNELTALSGTQVLASLEELPVQSWSYINDRAPVRRHVGPVAEDFHRLFGFGDEAHIAPADLAGVALLAIQGLQEELRDRDREIADLTRRLELLERAAATPRD